MSIQIIVLAAGKGTRMNSTLPKVSIPTFDGVPLIHHVCSIIDQLSTKYTLQKPIFVLGHHAPVVMETIDIYPNFNYTAVVQEPQLGTGHALMTVNEQINLKENTVLVLYGDVPNLDLNLIEQLIENHRGNLASFISFEIPSPNGYGKVIRSHHQFEAIKENRDCSETEKLIKECNSGICIFDGEFLNANIVNIGNDNSNKEYYLVDLINLAPKNRVGIVKASKPILGVNSPSELSDLNQQLIKQNRDFILNKYSTQLVVSDYQSLYMSKTVQFSGNNQIHIGPNTFIFGKCTIGEGVVIEGNCYLKDCNLGAYTYIHFGCKIVESVIGSNTKIGPFAHIRPESNIGDDCKVGNFVEIKKSSLDKKIAVSHLSYIGDCQIEEGVNVGAGTITCNYDGKNKYQTHIRKGAFIGSNTSIVAPANIGENSVIGAGSVVTKEVPDESLYLTRSKPFIKNGWKKN